MLVDIHFCWHFGLATEDDDGAMLTKNLINKTMENSLRKAIIDNHIETEEVKEVLNNFGYSKLSEIEVENLKDIREALIGE